MPEDGWIKLHRKLRNNEVWQKKPFSKGQAWIDLLLRVQHHTHDFLIKNKIIKLQPGQVYIFKKNLARDWGWSRTKVTNFLNILAGRNRNQDNKMITTSEPLCENETQKKTHFGTLITIINWVMYQTEISKKDTKKDMRKTRERHKQECKNEKEIRDIIEFLNKTLDKAFKVTTLTTRTLIRKRLAEGCTLDEFKLVIKNRKDRWENDKKMRDHLTPATLFAQENFEKYLQDAKTSSKRKGGAIL